MKKFILGWNYVAFSLCIFILFSCMCYSSTTIEGLTKKSSTQHAKKIAGINKNIKANEASTDGAASKVGVANPVNPA